MTAKDVAEKLEDLAAQMRRGDFTDSSEVLVLCRDEEIGLITFLRWGDATGLLEEAASIKRPNA